MHNMRDYFVTILCTCLKNVFNYIQVNINLGFFYHSCRSAAILKSHSFFVPLVNFQIWGVEIIYGSNMHYVHEFKAKFALPVVNSAER